MVGAGTDINISYADDGSGDATFTEIRFNLTAIPEPSSLALLGLVGLLLFRLRKAKM